MKSLRKETAVKFFAAIALAAVTTLASGCATQVASSGAKPSAIAATATAPADSAREQRIELAEEAVRNGKYELPDIGTFQLKDGNYQEKYGDGATQIKRVGVVTVAFGDIDGDHVVDAAVVLWANTGGTGTFMYLAPVLNKDGKTQQAGAQLLGDRVQIKSLAVETGKIKVALLTQGAGDPMASPSVESVQEYGLKGGTLVNLTPAASTTPAALKPTPQPTAQTSKPAATPSPRPTVAPTSQPAKGVPSDLVGSIWAWQRFVDSAEKGSFVVPFAAAYRLELLPEGKFSFQADCNSGSGSYTLEGSRLILNPGPVTLAECQAGSRSSQFVQMLGQVATYVYKDGALYLNLKMDGGDMVLSRLNSVTGRLVGPAGFALPTGAMVEVTIANNAGTQVAGWLGKAQQLPLQFEVPYKPANIDAAATYTLKVTISDAQKNILLNSVRPYQVLIQGNPTYHLEVELEPAR